MQVQYYQPVPPHHMLYHLSSSQLPPQPSCLGGPPQCQYYAAPAFISPFAVLPQPPPPPPPQQQQQPPPPPAAYYGYAAGPHPQHPHQQLPPLPPPMPPPPTSPLSGLMLQFQSLTIGGYAAEGAMYAACHYGQDYQSKLLTWLKTHRMHKYFDRLRKYSFEQLLAIDRPTLEALEFTQGAIKKLLGMLERVRQDGQAFDCPSRSSGSPCSSGACSEEELHLHGGLLRSPPRHLHQQQPPPPPPPPQQQQQAMLRNQPIVHQQHRMLGPLPLSLPLQPLPPPPPPHHQHPQHPQQQQQQLHQQQRQQLRYTSVSRSGGSCGSPA